MTAVLDTLERMLDAGTTADVARLARLAVDRITGSSTIDEACPDQAPLDRAIALYARACAAHPPDPGELADWFLAMSFGEPARRVSLHDFAEALGRHGLARIRSTVDERLAASTVECPEPVVERLGQELAELTGEVGGLVAAWEKRLPNIEVSLKIVRVLRAVGRHSDALAHAARVRGSDPSRIGDLLAAGRDDDAWTLTRNLLGGHGSARNVDDDGDPGPDHGASQADPAGVVIDLYRRHIDSLIDGRDSRNPAANYARAAAALRRLRTLHRDAGIPNEFTDYLAGLVERHRRKTRLLDEIRAARIAVPKQTPKQTARPAAEPVRK
ncbi:hypothetical protein FHS23_000489 [Prauserella isguenensis]|uniref:Uncharacterized protein n=1 Tax=Prauserella isguenensis TaxID=1470180 RepID=A0A839RWQ7_9PSEU|nr:hypothetical protein [Prauserella isguenensis]MBB3049494.1 hypothetical protein [Prauserella isguenensis]